MTIPSRLSSTFLGSGLVTVLAHHNTIAGFCVGLAIGVELLVFFNDGLG